MNIYKAVIVDDEQNIREGLRKVIDWEAYGFCICGEASDGEEGLALIGQCDPDLAIVDIKMPGMNGIDMIREMKKRELKCKSVILSGYSDFAYAQSAMEYGVEYYLLKPIDRFELCDKVRLIHEALEKENREKELFAKSFRISRDGILESLISGDGDMELVAMANEKFGFQFPWSEYRIVLISPADREAMDEGRYQAAARKISEYTETCGLGLAFGTGADFALLLRDNHAALHPGYAGDIRTIVFETCGQDAFFAEGSLVNDMRDIYSSYLQAHKLLQNRFVLGTEKVITAETARSIAGFTKHPGDNAFNVAGIIPKLYSAVDANQPAAISCALEEARSGFIRMGYPPAAVKTMYAYLYADIVNRLLMSNELLRGLFEFSENEFHAIFRCNDIWQLHDFMKGRFFAMSQELARSRPDDTMERILDYISRNIGGDLKLESLARTFHYNSEYLGKLFKKHTGQYFNQYLDMVRMNEAQRLLSSGCKVYQVAEKIGYDNIRYFHAKFKKYTGKSPTEFKRGDQ